jgi:FACT complex subunit SSRP1/POB3
LTVSSNGITWESTSDSRKVEVTADDVTELSWSVVGADRFQFKVADEESETQFVGFQGTDYAKLLTACQGDYKAKLERVTRSSKGWNWGDFQFTETGMRFDIQGESAFSLPLNSISQSIIQGKHEVGLLFHGDDTTDNLDMMCEMRVYVPPSMGT